MPDEKDQIKQLKKQIKQLEQMLGRKDAEKAISEAFLDIACEKLGEDVEEFKKKADSVLSDKPVEESQQ